MKNFFTRNAALVEIKTPSTPLLGRKYRNIYNVSEDLGGSVMQVLTYRSSLQREFLGLASAIPKRLEAFEPRCVVIVGNTSEVRADPNKLASLELYRGSCPTVAIITFDELFAKTTRLINVLETAA